MRRIFYGWWIVLAACIGQSTSPGQFVFAAMGLFIVPLGAEFGWNRAEVSLALTLFTLAVVVTLPFAGRAIDRYGARQVLLPSVVILGVGLASVALLVDKLWQFYAVYLAMGLLASGANSPPYMRLIVAWFDRRRGLALGLAIAGSGIGYAYVPPLLQYVNTDWGWRGGYLALAGIILLIAAPVLWAVVRNSPAELGLEPDGSGAKPAASPSDSDGLAFGDVVRHRVFWQIVIIFGPTSLCLYGILAHLVPLLTDRQMSGESAAFAASLLGVTIMVARVVLGYLVDRIFAPRVAVACFVAAALGFATLAAGAVDFSAYVAAFLIGLALGVEMDLLAFFVSRYFGLRAFGQIYGLLFSILLIGVAFGPLGFGTAHQMTGDYAAILPVCALVLTISAVTAMRLPRFPARFAAAP